MFDSGMTSTIASSSLFIVIAVPLAASILLRAARLVLKGCRVVRPIDRLSMAGFISSSSATILSSAKVDVTPSDLSGPAKHLRRLFLLPSKVKSKTR
jgi:hypothetical protein